MCVVDFDPPKFYTEEWRRCRAPFVCKECGVDVTKNEMYRNTTGMWDGDISTHKLCSGCAKLSEAVIAVGCSYCFDTLLEDATHAVEQFAVFGDHAEAPAEAQGRVIGLLWAARDREKQAKEVRHA